MPEPWTTSASASLGGTDGIVTLVEGSAFCFSSRSGEIDPDRPQGLDLPRHALPVGVAAAAERQRARVARRDDAGSVQRRVRAARSAGARAAPTRTCCCSGAATSAAACAKTSRSSNFGEEAAFCSVEIATRRRLRRPVRGEGRPGREARRALGAATRTAGSRSRTSAAAFRRATLVDFSELPRIAGEHVTYEVIVPPRGTWSTCMQVTPVLDTHEITPRYVCGQPVERSTPGRPPRGVDSAGSRSSRSDHDQFRVLLERSTRRPRGAAHLRPRVPGPRGRRGRRAVVHDAVRSRLAAHVVDDDARRSRSRARDAADAGPFPGHARSTRSPRRSRAASCTRCASARPRRSRSAAGASTTAPPTRRRCS